MKKILIVEDDPAISMVLKAFLINAGFEAEQAFEGERAIALFEQWEPSLVLLDVMLPDMDGWSILQRIRKQSACPVIMLTALGDIKSRLEGLHGGADDYISKPFVGDEVVARIQAVLRRLPQVVTENAVIIGRMKIDYTSREVWFQGNRVHLTPRDLDLLLFLTSHPNQTFEREHLIQCVWGVDYEGSDRAVDLAIKRIRQSLIGCTEDEGEIVTFRRIGYQFRVKTPSKFHVR
ncbi:MULTISPECIES: response regulator transcription factor [Cohnella]|uniref:DNA-binding response OmpR family regulator n=1 Tax=Cohnella phaseoli TaxID=456490 RepID=A0A3D9KG44_9BACL|nr:response regulator transcription factor [Cohnella phaseoli]RED85435.1 DNA-binding response OmpR family regulator [Cohnella phaseoli]